MDENKMPQEPPKDGEPLPEQEVPKPCGFPAEGIPPMAEPVLAELCEPDPVPQPRIWTALLVGIGVIPVSLVVATTVLLVAAAIDAGPKVLTDPGAMMKWTAEFCQTRLGLMAVLIPGQCVFLFFAVFSAALSPRGFAPRLAWRRGALPLWTWIVFALATPLVGLVSSILLSCMVDELSEQLKMLEQIMRGHADGFFLGLILLVAVLPGIVEETLFRGYLQSRLLERWNPTTAILVSAIIFSAAHLDPLHAVGVLPLGIWFGVVAWKSDSILPAILCHIVNNTVAIVGLQFQEPQTLGVVFDPFMILCFTLSLPAFLLALLIFRNRTRPSEPQYR